MDGDGCGGTPHPEQHFVSGQFMIESWIQDGGAGAASITAEAPSPVLEEDWRALGTLIR